MPNRIDQDFRAIVGSCDVLVITGGDRDPIRDTVERELFDEAMLVGRPIVGVCHGLQRLTEMMGGTVEPLGGHHGTEHDVIDHLGNRHAVNSFHNFGISRLPDGAAVLATDPDGNCESWVIGNVSGVMWHPERQPFGWLPGDVAQVLVP